MALLSDRIGFDKSAMQQVEMEFLREVLESAKEQPNALVLTSANYEKLSHALQAAKRLSKDRNPYTSRNGWRFIWAIERQMKSIRNS